MPIIGSELWQYDEVPRTVQYKGRNNPFIKTLLKNNDNDIQDCEPKITELKYSLLSLLSKEFQKTRTVSRMFSSVFPGQAGVRAVGYTSVTDFLQACEGITEKRKKWHIEDRSAFFLPGERGDGAGGGGGSRAPQRRGRDRIAGMAGGPAPAGHAPTMLPSSTSFSNVYQQPSQPAQPMMPHRHMSLPGSGYPMPPPGMYQHFADPRRQSFGGMPPGSWGAPPRPQRFSSMPDYSAGFARPPGPPRRSPTGEFEITYAAYGSRDITSAIRHKYRQGVREFDCSKLVWGDPDFGRPAFLVVVYKDLFGDINHITAHEGERLRLPFGGHTEILNRKE